MARQLVWALSADGGTDRALVPLLTWTIRQLDPEVQVLSPSFQKHSRGVDDASSLLDSVQILFVHRDAEGMTYQQRLSEFDLTSGILVPVIPVRMTEAWLLGDATAIANAAQNPSALVEVVGTSDVENVSNPKAMLEGKLIEASGQTTGRRRKMFQAGLVDRRVDVSNWTDDWNHLLGVPSYRSLVASLRVAYPYRSSITSWGI